MRAKFAQSSLALASAVCIAAPVGTSAAYLGTTDRIPLADAPTPTELAAASRQLTQLPILRLIVAPGGSDSADTAGNDLLLLPASIADKVLAGETNTVPNGALAAGRDLAAAILRGANTAAAPTGPGVAQLPGLPTVGDLLDSFGAALFLATALVTFPFSAAFAVVNGTPEAINTNIANVNTALATIFAPVGFDPPDIPPLPLPTTTATSLTASVPTGLGSALSSLQDTGQRFGALSPARSDATLADTTGSLDTAPEDTTEKDAQSSTGSDATPTFQQRLQQAIDDEVGKGTTPTGSSAVKGSTDSDSVGGGKGTVTLASGLGKPSTTSTSDSNGETTNGTSGGKETGSRAPDFGKHIAATTSGTGDNAASNNAKTISSQGSGGEGGGGEGGGGQGGGGRHAR
jgi:hypothetical protein